MPKIAINIATGSLQKEEIIVGIDLGTTNSLVAIIHPESKQPTVLKEHNSSALVPSIIHFTKQGNIVVGEDAKPFLTTDPLNTIFSAKRLIGKTYKEVAQNIDAVGYKIIDNKDGLVKVQVNDVFYSPVDLSAQILKQLKTSAEHILKTPVSKAVITVPAYFNDTQRQATRDAGKLAGLDVLRIINEPTAASLAYGFGLNSKEEKKIAVYDLGGGTFDISILNISNGIFEVLSTNGDTFLGGDDIDALIVNYWLQQYNFDERISINVHKQQLRLQAEEAKIHLSNHDEFSTNYLDVKLSISKNIFETLISPLVNKTIVQCGAALKDAKLQYSDINEVVMVGGSTRIPYIKKMVSEYFKQKVNDTVNPDEVVALGAAIQADILAGNTKNMLLLDVTPLSLGLETMGGLMDVLLPRNSKIPTKAARQYTTHKDGQSGIRISVFQGERDMVVDNRKLAEFNLSGIPSMPAGLAKVEVSFVINADGILMVKAKELRSGVEQNIEVKSQLDLTDNTVENMLLDAMKNAESDISLRALVEAQTEGEQLLIITENFIKKNINKLQASEILSTSSAMQDLQLALTLKDKNLIQNKIEALNNISRPYAERIMDNAINTNLQGKSIS
jgi:molecular chaperone HscA